MNNTPRIPDNTPNSASKNTIVLPMPNPTKRICHSRPPLKLDRQFYYHKPNKLKLIQLATGFMCFMLTQNCYPNNFAGYCTGEWYSIGQIFIIVCVVGFFFVATLVLLLFSIFGVFDTYYQFNFPVLEKFYTTMASFFYAVACFISFIAIVHAVFSLIWPFHLATVFAGFLAYFIECYQRWLGTM